jgi:bifunctional ADP-heptose synthase (sugar kinase/adenylyltransferase)
VNVRSQPGAAGTILNNLVALGIGAIAPVGFCGQDGEGYELLAAMAAQPGVCLDHFLQTPQRRTFTYCKPLVLEPGRPPRELNRLDSKNWDATPEPVRRVLGDSFGVVSESSDAVILMDQVDLAETGVVTSDLLGAVREKATSHPELLMIGDSRRSLKNWPLVWLKMNNTELSTLTRLAPSDSIEAIKMAALNLARDHARPVFVTLAERGIVGAEPGGLIKHQPAFPIRGTIDIVGAGDAVMANLTAALAAGATLSEALELAIAAASVVVHQLGTTGAARVEDLRAVLFAN